jgi:hypothetical protein
MAPALADVNGDAVLHALESGAVVDLFSATS